MTVLTRTVLQAIRDPQELDLGLDLAGVVNLAGNELPSPPPAAVLKAIADTAALVNQYPQMACGDLTSALARHHRIDPIGVVVGNGSANVMLQLLNAVCEPSDEVVFSAPGFEGYPHLVHLAGGTLVPVPLLGDGEDLKELLTAVKRRSARAVFLCNPFNPTGAVIHDEALQNFLDEVPENVLVVLDEAYHDFVTDPDVPDGIGLAVRNRWDNVAAVRTFSKAFALGGLRVGYAVTSARLATAARKCAIPYSVNVVAQAAAVAAIGAADELRPVHDQVREQRGSLHGALLDGGFRVPNSHANFLWLPLGARAAAFHAHCRSQKIQVRLFPGEGVRVTVGSPSDNEAFLAAVRTFPGH